MIWLYTINPDTINPNTINPEKARKFRKTLRNILETNIEAFFRLLLFWETDTKKLGILIRSIHQFFIIALFVCYIIVHTIVPSYWFLCIVWFIATIIWAHHILTGCCIFTRIEQRLIGDKLTISDPVLEIFHISPTKENTIGFTIIISTLCCIFLSFELFTRSLLNVKTCLDI
jgi:hypothetical protein